MGMDGFGLHDSRAEKVVDMDGGAVGESEGESGDAAEVVLPLPPVVVVVVLLTASETVPLSEPDSGCPPVSRRIGDAPILATTLAQASLPILLSCTAPSKMRHVVAHTLPKPKLALDVETSRLSHNQNNHRTLHIVDGLYLGAAAISHEHPLSLWLKNQWIEMPPLHRPYKPWTIAWCPFRFETVPKQV